MKSLHTTEISGPDLAHIRVLIIELNFTKPPHCWFNTTVPSKMQPCTAGDTQKTHRFWQQQHPVQKSCCAICEGHHAQWAFCHMFHQQNR